MKSWKTSLGGILSAIGLGLTQSGDETLKLIGGVLASIGVLLTGLAARDNNVTSEQVGATKPE